jgi:hypothetical protein
LDGPQRSAGPTELGITRSPLRALRGLFPER